jgi:thiamine-phosphate pyrophosphorylase
MLVAARIIDASLNRAREALRTMEDIARFGIGDGRLCESFKSLRHALTEFADNLPIDAGVRLAARDIETDVGTSISTAGEMSRAGLRDIAGAAGGRLQESLRSIEEQCKTLPQGGSAAKRAEALRYRAYVVDQQLLLTIGTGRARQWKLCVLVSEDVCTHMPWEQVVEAAIAGGADCIQLREKRLGERELLKRARRMVDICRKRQVTCIINDRADIALLAGADGVHIGETDLPVHEVRRIVGFQLLIGVSTSHIEFARAAAAHGADYMGVGPMFSSSTKPKPNLSGPEYLREYLADPATAGVPHLAISGISLGTLPELVQAGVQGIAVSSAVCRQTDPAAAAQSLLNQLAAQPQAIPLV